MTVPVLVRAPAGPVVALDDLKSHLRTDFGDEDALIQAYEAAAVQHLDGYRGTMGRCILEQDWAVIYGQAGTFRLPLPDVVSVSAEDGDGAAVEAVLSHDALGALVSIPAPARVTMTCALPGDALAVVQMAVKLLVGHWYAHRESVITGTIATNLPLAFDALIDPLRWVRL